MGVLTDLAWSETRCSPHPLHHHCLQLCADPKGLRTARPQKGLEHCTLNTETQKGQSWAGCTGWLQCLRDYDESPFLSRAPRFLRKEPRLLHPQALAPPQKILGLCLFHRAVATPEHPDSYSLRLLPGNTQAPPSSSGSTSKSTQAPPPRTPC